MIIRLNITPCLTLFRWGSSLDCSSITWLSLSKNREHSPARWSVNNQIYLSLKLKYLIFIENVRFVTCLFNLTAVLKSYWKNLQILSQDDKSVKLKDYLKNWDENFRKNIPFYSYENRLKHILWFLKAKKIKKI